MSDSARLRAVLDTMTDAVVVTDSASRIETFNAAAEQIFGYSADEVIGQDIAILMPEPYRSHHSKYVARFLQGGAPRIIGVGGREVKALRKDGSVFPAELGIGVLVEDGVTKFTGIVRDLTERARAEAKLRQAQKLEAVGRLASGIAHDFNNLLMAISGCAEMAGTTLPVEHQAHEYLEALKGEVLRGGRITRQLLAFGRRDGEDIETVSVDATIGDALPLLERLLGEDIEFDVRLDADGAHVSCRSGQLEQAILNLAINARDAMPDGGRLTIETVCADKTRGDEAPEELSCGRYVRVRVSDTGEGMDADTRARIFDPFFTTKAEGKGTGLGLAIVYGAVREAGGAVQVESEVGRGTSFELSLPLADSLPAARTAREELVSEGAAVGDGPSVTVLIAEDQALVRRVVRHRLERQGYRVIEADSGLQAIERIRAHGDEVGLLLTDVGLPGASGGQVAAELRARRPEVPVIFMSAHPRDVLFEEGRIPAHAVTLQKPFGESALLDAVRSQLGAAPRERVAVRPRRVLLVEDQPIVRQAMRMMLQEMGCETSAVASGRDAIATLERAPGSSDLVVTDLGLPDMTGWTLAEELTARAPSLGVVFASGSPEAELRGHVATAPAVAFLPKPVSMGDLERTVNRVLEALADAVTASKPSSSG